MPIQGPDRQHVSTAYSDSGTRCPAQNYMTGKRHINNAFKGAIVHAQYYIVQTFQAAQFFGQRSKVLSDLSRPNGDWRGAAESNLTTVTNGVEGILKRGVR